LLSMSLRPNPADPRRMAERAASIALFSPYPGTREPRSILAESLDGVDRDLLYPAIQSLLENQDAAVRGSLGGIYSKLDDRDVVRLLPAVIQAIKRPAPSNEMFVDSIRLAGLDLLARLQVREGMALGVALIEPDRWGMGRRLPNCLNSLVRYGANAQSIVPQLQEIRAGLVKTERNKESADTVKALDKAIAEIAASTTSSTLVSVEEFLAKPIAN